MNPEEQIQISYEDEVSPLSPETEHLICKNMLKLLDDTGNGEKNVSLFFCGINTIQTLNKTYRDVDRPTDILSWSYEIPDSVPESEPWGELAICLDVCKKQADTSGLSLETELLRLLVHGLGHLMGYDHELSDEEEKKMLEMEKRLLSSIDLDGLYD